MGDTSAYQQILLSVNIARHYGNNSGGFGADKVLEFKRAATGVGDEKERHGRLFLMHFIVSEANLVRFAL